MKIILKKNYLFIIFYLTILIGFYFDEDLLGGAKHDYLFHIRFIELFSKDFIPNIVKIIDPMNTKTGLVPIIAWTIETGPEVIAIIINILARAAPSSVDIINGPFFILVR